MKSWLSIDFSICIQESTDMGVAMPRPRNPNLSLKEYTVR